MTRHPLSGYVALVCLVLLLVLPLVFKAGAR